MRRRRLGDFLFVATAAGADEVLASELVQGLVEGSDFAFEARGEFELTDARKELASVGVDKYVQEFRPSASEPIGDLTKYSFGRQLPERRSRGTRALALRLMVDAGRKQ